MSNELLRFWDDRRPSGYRLVPFLVKDGKPHPFVLIIPGGAYAMCANFVEGKPFALRCNRQGLHAFVLYYRTGKQARFPHPQDDVARALRSIRDNARRWKVETEGYSVWGASAGGHLAASFCTRNMGYEKYGLPAPSSLVLIYPVVTMGDRTHGVTRDNLLGPAPSKEQILFTSVERQVTPSFPPTFLWCSEADEAVPWDNSRMLAQALRENGVECDLRVYPGVPHGAGLAEGTSAEGWIDEALAFCLAHRK